jgi:LuxR family transcriptional regulator, maltose regulon positive regulatory protein
LRISVLGGFDLARDGEPLRFTGKAQQRPLDLLKALLAFGGDRVDSQQLMAALWPDADGSAAKTSFDTTLFRLRKLLDIDNAIVLAAGKLSLDHSLAWTDLWTFDTALADAERATDPHGTGKSAVDAARALLAAYRGPLLANEENAWVVKPRDALRARFVRTLMRLGGELEQNGEWTEVVDIYRRGLEADNLSELLYRGLMRSLAAMGDQAEAVNAFRRCRELLSVVLGMKPSAETERLYREIIAGRTPASLS